MKKADGWRWNAPLFCEPVRHRALAYVDVTSAFWQLVSPFRPDDVPLPGGEVIEGEMDWLSPEVIDGDRRLRHAVVGSLFYSELPIYCYGKACEIRVRNYWTSPALRRLTMSSLHAMAQGVRRRFGLHAWLTDAAIVDARVADDVVDWLAVHWASGPGWSSRGLATCGTRRRTGSGPRRPGTWSMGRSRCARRRSGGSRTSVGCRVRTGVRCGGRG